MLVDVTTPAPARRRRSFICAFLQHRRLAKSEAGKKSTDHRLNQACQPCATLSSTSSFDRFSDARTAEDGSARDHGVN
jgi:hypothetical protein